MSATALWESLLSDMVAHAPPMDEPKPLSNRKEVIWGSTLSLMILTWVAISMRLYVRLKVLKNPGWDDALVLFSACCNTGATIMVCLSVNWGVGDHMLYIGLSKIESYLKFFYITHGIYLIETATIKLSLLCQYLRIFTAGRMHTVCITMVWLVSIWGAAFSIMGWFPCWPISGIWHRVDGTKCYGFGFETRRSFAAMFETHTATNMTWDFLIFIIPLVLFRTPNLKPRHLLLMTGIFAFGALVVFMSVWRLYSIVEHRAGLYPYPDFTWWTPVSFILSCVEIDLAILTASIPIFWPHFSKSITDIFVSHEIHIEEERKSDDGERGLTLTLEMNCKGNGGPGSTRSNSAASTYALTNIDFDTPKEDNPPVPQYSVGVDPLGEEAMSGQGLQTHVHTGPRSKWAL